MLIQEFFKYFQNGYSFFNKTDICSNEINKTIDVLKGRIKQVERKMQDRHAAVPKVDYYKKYNSLILIYF